jgi:hypothetical protein
MKKIIPVCGTDQVIHTHSRISPFTYIAYYGFPEIGTSFMWQIVALVIF